MLDRLIPPPVREALQALSARLIQRTPPGPSVLPGLDTAPRPMRPLHPPAALNDNPLAGLESGVERDLRARGFLR